MRLAIRIEYWSLTMGRNAEKVTHVWCEAKSASVGLLFKLLVLSHNSNREIGGSTNANTVIPDRGGMLLLAKPKVKLLRHYNNIIEIF